MDYFALKAEQKKREEDRQQNIMKQRNDAFINSTKTRQSTIPDMRSAYQAVRDVEYTPTEEEIHYRRFTSGSWLDGASHKKK